MNTKLALRMRRKLRIRKKLNGTAERPRLSVFVSNTNIYLQLIDDAAGKTLASVSTLTEKIAPTIDGAKKLSALLASKMSEKKVETIVFDRNGKQYHGKVKAVAESLREAGISF